LVGLSEFVIYALPLVGIVSTMAKLQMMAELCRIFSLSWFAEDGLFFRAQAALETAPFTILVKVRQGSFFCEVAFFFFHKGGGLLGNDFLE